MTDEQEIVGTEADMEDSRIYEAAFHIVPSLDEAGAAAEVADIKKFLVFPLSSYLLPLLF